MIIGTYRGTPVNFEKHAILVAGLVMAILVLTGSIGSATTLILFGVLFSVSVLIHEITHAEAFYYFGYTPKQINFSFLGGSVGITEGDDWMRDPVAEVFIAVAGPIASLIFGLMLLVIPFDICTVVAYVTFLMSAFNMIPIFPLDGGHVLRGILHHAGFTNLKGVLLASSITCAFGVGWGVFVWIDSIILGIGAASYLSVLAIISIYIEVGRLNTG